MSAATATDLARWLAMNQPKVFQVLVEEASRRGQLRGVTDWLSSVGTSVSSAIKNVGSFLTSKEGMTALTGIGTAYLQTQAQRDALRAQVQMVQAGQSLLPIQSVGPNPNSALPVYVDPRTGQQMPWNTQLSQQLAPYQSPYLPLILLGGVGLIMVVAFSRH